MIRGSSMPWKLSLSQRSSTRSAAVSFHPLKSEDRTHVLSVTDEFDSAADAAHGSDLFWYRAIVVVDRDIHVALWQLDETQGRTVRREQVADQDAGKEINPANE